jgi:hypothetical protein
MRWALRCRFRRDFRPRRTSSGSLAKFAAMRRASSLVGRLVEASNRFSGQITLRTDFFYRRSR